MSDAHEQPTRNDPHAFIGTGDERCKYLSCGRHRTAALHEIESAATAIAEGRGTRVPR